MWVLLVPVLLVAVVAGRAAFVKSRPTKDAQYVGALQAAGMLNEFPANRAAILSGQKVCSDIDGGGNDQGTPAGKVAVRYFCPTYLANYKILRSAQVTGTFLISDATYDPSNEFETPNFQNVGSGCEGSGGFGDLNASTQVVVTDNHGAEVARTALGSGIEGADGCTFTFTFHLTEGAGQYIVTVGKRGSTNYTFDEIINANAVSLVIGAS